MVTFDETSLRKAFDQPTGSLNEFIRAALGLYQFLSREQRVERAFTAWVAEHSILCDPCDLCGSIPSEMIKRVLCREGAQRTRRNGVLLNAVCSLLNFVPFAPRDTTPGRCVL